MRNIRRHAARHYQVFQPYQSPPYNPYAGLVAAYNAVNAVRKYWWIVPFGGLAFYIAVKTVPPKRD